MYLARMSKADIVPPTCAVWTSDDCLYVDGLGTNDSEVGHALSACVNSAGSVGTKSSPGRTAPPPSNLSFSAVMLRPATC